jgi:hypothetical protein
MVRDSNFLGPVQYGRVSVRAANRSKAVEPHVAWLAGSASCERVVMGFQERLGVRGAVEPTDDMQGR